MKTRRKILALALIASISMHHLTAQSIDDGLRMSQIIPSGTARFTAMGGAFGAVGSDFSSIDVNPAGLGVYRSSEFTFSPSFSSTKSRTLYNGTRATDTERGFALDNMGFVLAINPSGNTDNGLCQLNFGFGYNRSNTFRTNTITKGTSDNSSILDYFAAKARSYNNIEPIDLQFGYDNTGTMIWDPTENTNAPWEMIMAWNTYLLDDNGTEYFSPIDKYMGIVHQKQNSETSGNTGEYNISMGLSLSNKVYLGLSMGISSHKHQEIIKYQEDADPTNAATSFIRFNNMNYNREFNTESSGINVKMGAIYTPIPMLRFGLSVHTPTFYSVKHRYAYNMTSNVDTIDGANKRHSISAKLSPNEQARFTGQYKYRFETPFRLTGSAAVVLGGMAMVSLDVEHVNYANMKFRRGEDGDDLNDLNEFAHEVYRNTFNMRLGGEMVLGNVALRTGYAFYQAPYKREFENHTSHSHLISAGVGYSTNIGFFIDAAYQQNISPNKYTLYSWEDGNNTHISPLAKTTYSTGKFVITCGFRF